MKSNRKDRLSAPHGMKSEGFSLMEVVIALGVFAFAVALLLTWLGRSGGWIRDAEQRARMGAMIAAVDAAIAEVGWDASMNGGRPGVLERTRGQAWVLVGTENASWVGPKEDATAMPEAQQFYEVSIVSSETEGDRLGQDLRAVRVLEITVSWPYRLPTADGVGFREVEAAARDHFSYWSAVRP